MVAHMCAAAAAVAAAATIVAVAAATAKNLLLAAPPHCSFESPFGCPVGAFSVAIGSAIMTDAGKKESSAPSLKKLKAGSTHKVRKLGHYTAIVLLLFAKVWIPQQHVVSDFVGDICTAFCIRQVSPSNPTMYCVAVRRSKKYRTITDDTQARGRNRLPFGYSLAKSLNNDMYARPNPKLNYSIASVYISTLCAIPHEDKRTVAGNHARSLRFPCRLRTSS